MPAKEKHQKSDDDAARQRSSRASEQEGVAAPPAAHPADILQRAATDPGALTPAEMRTLQKTLGNRSLGRRLSGAADSQRDGKPASRGGEPFSPQASLQRLVASRGSLSPGKPGDGAGPLESSPAGQADRGPAPAGPLTHASAPDQVQRLLGKGPDSKGLPLGTEVVFHLETGDEAGFVVDRYSERTGNYTLRNESAGITRAPIKHDDINWGTKANATASRSHWASARGVVSTAPFDYGQLLPNPDYARTDFRYWFYYMLEQIARVDRKTFYLQLVFEPNQSRTVVRSLSDDNAKRQVLNAMFGEGFVSYEQLQTDMSKTLIREGAQLANPIPGETHFGYGFRGDNRKPDTIKSVGGFTTKAESQDMSWRETQGLNADWNPFKYQAQLPGQNVTGNAGFFRRADTDNDLTTIISVTPNFVDASKFPFIHEYRQGSTEIDTPSGRRIRSTSYIYLVLVEQGFDTKAAQGGNPFPEIATRTVPWSNFAAVYEIERTHYGQHANDGHIVRLKSVQILDGVKARYAGTPAWSAIKQAVEAYAGLGELVYKPADESQYPPAMKPRSLKFAVKYATRPGQDLYVAGSVPELGNWDPNQAKPLGYVNDQLWSGEVSLSPTSSIKAGAKFQYKYIMKEGSSIRWEGDPNHLYDVSVRVGSSTPDSWH